MEVRKRGNAPLEIIALVAIMLLAPTLAHAACSNPTASAGAQFYNTTYSVMQYCNGTDWVNMGSPASAGPTGGVGTLNSGSFCTTDGTVVNCTTPAINLSGSMATGTLAAARMPALTGDVTTSAGAVATTIANSAVTNAKMANMAANTIKGNNTGGATAPLDLTVAQATAMLNAVVGDSGSGGTKGLVPAPASGDAAASKFLKADGTWTAVNTSTNAISQGDSNVTVADAGTGSVTVNVDGGARLQTSAGGTTLSGTSVLSGANSQLRINDTDGGSSGVVQVNSGMMRLGNWSNGGFVGIDMDNSRVGIGTTSPTSKLNIKQAGGGWTDGLRLTNNTNDHYGDIIMSTVGIMQFGIDGGEKMRLDASGNVGIGTTSTLAKLQVEGTENTNHIATGVGGNLRFTVGTDASANVLLRSQNNLDLRLGVGADSITIKNGGNVGIGTTSPAAKLQVGSGGQTISLGTGSNTSGYALSVGVNDDGINFTNNSMSRGFNFANANGMLVSIASDGNVGVGTASPSYLLHVNGTAYATGAAGALSDVRHKSHIATLGDGALELVTRLRPVTFEWKPDVIKDDGMKGIQTGFIAQEVEGVLPMTVMTESNAEHTKNLKYNEFTPLLVKAVQELKAANDNLASENAKLRSDIEALKVEVRGARR